MREGPPKDRESVKSPARPGTGVPAGIVPAPSSRAMPDPNRSDRVLPIARVLFGALALVVFPFFWGLTVHPENTAENFAWPLAPRMSALLFGTLYMAVVYSFLRVAIDKRWHEARLIFVTTLPVLVALGLVSWAHWDKFTDDPKRLAVWITAYMVFPPFLLWMIWAHRGRDSRQLEPGDVFVPVGVRRFSLVIGILFGVVGLLLLLAPDTMAGVWPWAIKPLSSRAIGALLIAPLCAQVTILSEERWSALKLPIESGILWFGGVLVSIVRCWDEFDRSRPMTWAFVAAVAIEWLLVVWMYVAFELRRARGAAVSAR